jgi:hypothetical protein
MANSWREKRNHLERLIRKVSEMYGGDDSKFLEDYVKDVINEYGDNLDVAIDCFESITGKDALCEQRSVIIAPMRRFTAVKLS